jgi:hypothetical protein
VRGSQSPSTSRQPRETSEPKVAPDWIQRTFGDFIHTHRTWHMSPLDACDEVMSL